MNWITSSEYNNDYFTIEKSQDGINFISIGDVNSRGDNQLEALYEFVDERPYSGYNYYRLKQTDFDGTSTTSHIIVINMKQKELEVNMFPNPVVDNFFVELPFTYVDKKCNLIVINAHGQLSLEQVFEGESEIQISTNNWVSGWYIIQLSFQDGTTSMEKIFVQ